MDDYTTLFDEAAEHARKAYYANGRMAETVSSEWLYRVRDALRALVAENAEQRSRIAALEAVIGFVRDEAIAWQNAPFSEVAPVPGVGDLFLKLVSAARSTVLDQMIREAKAEAWDAGFTACAHEHMHQRKDHTYPITRLNPHRMEF